MRSRFVPLLAVVVGLVLCGACKKPSPPVQDDEQPIQSVAPPASAPPPVIILLDAAPPGSSENAGAVALVTKWNAAHQKGDAAELQALFAPKVLVNGTTITAADHVKKSLNQDADVRSSIGEVKAETTPDGKETYAHFVKRLADLKGDTPKEYPKVIIVRDGVIVEESDDVVDATLVIVL